MHSRNWHHLALASYMFDEVRYDRDKLLGIIRQYSVIRLYLGPKMMGSSLQRALDVTDAEIDDFLRKKFQS